MKLDRSADYRYKGSNMSYSRDGLTIVAGFVVVALRLR
jgi:hypothetical protein